jgi:hypothetical protein
MLRTVWLALVCLICVGALSALRTSFGNSPMKVKASSFDAAVGSEREQEPLAKADRLDLNYLRNAPEEISVDTINTSRPAPTAPEVKLKEQATEVTSWHWHEGSKTIKRSDRTVSRAKYGD